jgi:N4-gp56 family major capsid protein
MAVVGANIDSVTNVNTTGSLPQEVATYYEKVFLTRATYELVLKEGGQNRTTPMNQGRSVNFTRYDPLTVITSPIGEASNPATCAINPSTVTMTLSEYGLTTTHGKLLTLTSIDSGMKEKAALVGQNMGETLNRLVRLELDNGTSYYGNSHTTATFTAGDTMDACDIRIMVQALEYNKAHPFQDGFYLGKVDSYSKYNLLGDSTWVNAKTYSDVQKLYAGEIGELYQVRWLLNLDDNCGIEATSTASSGVTRHFTYVHGQDAFGVYDLEGDQPKLTIIPNAVDSSSPAGRISFISWSGSYATKLLNPKWVIAARFAVV